MLKQSRLLAIALEFKNKKSIAIDWKPIPNSPQEAALNCKADELFFGGGAGGGKSYLLLGLTIKHHTRSIIYRREYPQLRGLIAASRKIVGDKGSYNGQEHIWKLSDGRTIEFGAVQYEHSVEKFQGVDHDAKCVGQGTLVWMANGSRKPIETIQIGEFVATLEGPRRVTRTIKQYKPAVKLTVWNNNKVVGSQLQSKSHRILMQFDGRMQWLCADDLIQSRTSQTCEATQYHCLDKSYELLRSRCSTRMQSHATTFQDTSLHLSLFEPDLDNVVGRLHQESFPFSDDSAYNPSFPFVASQSCFDRKFLKSLILKSSTSHPTSLEKYSNLRQRSLSDPGKDLHQSIQDLFSEKVHTGRQNDFAMFDDLPLTQQQQASRLYISLRHLQHQPHPKGSPSSSTSFLRDDYDAHTESSPVDFRSSCSPCFHRYDEPLRLNSKVFLISPIQQSIDAEGHIPKHSILDEKGKAPTHIRCASSYVHPYTMETRQSVLSLLAWQDFSIEIHDASFSDDQSIPLYDLTVDGANHYITESGLINKNCFDEVCHFTELQYRTLAGWARTADPNQRVRVVATGNPPAGYQGQWVRDYWGPWLDPNHANPAIPGELIWYVQDAGKSIEVARGDRRPAEIEIDGEFQTPRSRTFIPARVDDNPYYMATGYKAVLQSMPEPLRSQLLYGDFAAGGQDDPWQVFPSAWIDAAMARWTEEPPKEFGLSCLGGDPARGGADNSAVAERWGDWFEVHTIAGAETPDGPTFIQYLLSFLKGNPSINIDVIGVGSSPVDTLTQMGIECNPLSGADGSHATDRTGKLSFSNKRSEWLWKFREALEPDYDSAIALPPNPRMRAGFLAMRWYLSGWKITIEKKDEIKKRLGYSPDEAEAIVYASVSDEVENSWFGFGSEKR
jgi:hypothetical protein